MSPLVATVNELAELKRHSRSLRQRLYRLAAKPVAIVALAHLADLDESLRQAERILLFHSENILTAEESTKAGKGETYDNDTESEED